MSGSHNEKRTSSKNKKKVFTCSKHLKIPLSVAVKKNCLFLLSKLTVSRKIVEIVEMLGVSSVLSKFLSHEASITRLAFV